MKKYIIIVLVLCNCISFAQSNYILDSIVLPAKKFLNNNQDYFDKYNDGAKVGYALSFFFNSKNNHYYNLLNTENVNAPTSFLTLEQKLLQQVYLSGLQNDMIKMPDLSSNVKLYLDSLSIFYCKEMAKEKINVLEKKMFLQFVNKVKPLIDKNKNLQLLQKKAFEAFEPKDSSFVKSIDIYFLLKCPYYQINFFNGIEFSNPSNYEKVFESKHIGNYFYKMKEFYKNENYISLAKKFPNYKEYVSILNTIYLKDEYDVDNSKVSLVKLPSNKWIYTLYLNSSTLEKKNQYFAKLIFTFDSLEIKPTITKLELLKAKPNEKFRTDKEFIQWKKDNAKFSDFPPPPPPPPLPPFDPTLSKKEVEELKLLRKKKLEEW